MTKLQQKIKESVDLGQIVSDAKSLGTSKEYLTGHIYHARKVPRPEFFNLIQIHYKLEDSEMLDHFYKRDAD